VIGPSKEMSASQFPRSFQSTREYVSGKVQAGTQEILLLISPNYFGAKISCCCRRGFVSRSRHLRHSTPESWQEVKIRSVFLGANFRGKGGTLSNLSDPRVLKTSFLEVVVPRNVTAELTA
jgi:hypothetical protein